VSLHERKIGGTLYNVNFEENGTNIIYTVFRTHFLEVSCVIYEALSCPLEI